MVGLPVIGIASFLLLAFFKAKRAVRLGIETYNKQRMATAVPLYQAPHYLKPAELGYLFRLGVGKTEIRATLLDLQLREYIKLNENNIITSVVHQDETKLLEHERLVIELCSGSKGAPISYISMYDGGASVAVGIDIDVAKTRFVHALKNDLARKGFVVSSPRRIVMRKTLRVAACIMLWPMCAWAVGGAVGLAPDFFANVPKIAAIAGAMGIILSPFYIILSYLIVRTWIYLTSPHWLNAAAIRSIWPELLGYKQDIMEVNLEKIKFAAHNHANALSKTLPYAIVLDLEDDWVKYFVR